MCYKLTVFALLACLHAPEGMAQTTQMRRIEGMVVARPRPPERLFLVSIADQSRPLPAPVLEIAVSPDGRFTADLERGVYLVRQHPPCSAIEQFGINPEAGDVRLVFSPLPLPRDGAPGALTSLRISSFTVPLNLTTLSYSSFSSLTTLNSQLNTFSTPLTMNWGNLYGTGFGGGYTGSSSLTNAFYQSSWYSPWNSWNSWPGSKTHGGVVLSRSLPCAATQ